MTWRKRIPKKLAAVLLAAALTACGGGGGGGSDPVEPGGGSGATENEFSLTVLPGANETSASVALKLLHVDPTLPLAEVGGISAELLYDPAWIGFASFTPGPALGGGGQVVDLAGDPGRLLMALEGVSEGTLGTLHFDLLSTGNTGSLAWDGVTLIGVAGTVLPDRVLAPTGADLSN